MEWAKGRDLRAAACALLCALLGVAWQADAALATGRAGHGRQAERRR
jgi:hypothetical protein